MTGTVLILGASGHIGRHSTSAFSEAGWVVRHYDRAHNNMAEMATDANIIVNGLNPPHYKNWQTAIPAITQQVIAAATHTGATVIIPGNVYNFGNQAGVFDQHTPQVATTRKGKIRIAMEQQYRSAAKNGLRTIILRAGSFIDPNGNQDVMGQIHMRGINSRKLTEIGGTNTRHTYCYLPDWARAAVALSEMRNELDEFEDIPFPGHHFTVNELKAQLEKTTGLEFKINSFPWTLMRMLSPLWNLAYEMLEMRGLWETSHSLSGQRFHQLLPQFQATDLSTVMCCSLPPQIYQHTG